jgi:UDP-N-acetylmuramate dehydrogenase
MAFSLIQSHVALDGLNSLRLAARAARYCRIENAAELKALWQDKTVWGTGPKLVLGGGSNLVISGDIDGLVIHIGIRGFEFDRRHPDAVTLSVGAGESWDATVRRSLGEGEGGLENLISIPGQCGAAPVQNIGAYGVELAERLSSVEVFDCSSGSMSVLSGNACEFAYRDSLFKRHPGRYIITRLMLKLPRPWQPVLTYRDLAELSSSSSASDVADAVARIRSDKLPDPAKIGNVGSFFKNPVVTGERFAALRAAHPGMVGYEEASGGVKLAAAWLIDQAGLKGASQGDAAVHDRQALVIVNRGQATSSDVLGLAAHIVASVKQRFGVVLEQEPVLV